MIQDSADINDDSENESLGGENGKFTKLEIVGQYVSSHHPKYFCLTGSHCSEENDKLSSRNGEEDEKFRNI